MHPPQTLQEASTAATASAAAPVELTVAGARVEVFVESPPLMERMIADVRGATRRVWLEMYIFADDDAGRRMVAAIAERASAGVECRVLVDAVGSALTPDSLFDPILQAGGQVHHYHAFGKTVLRSLRFDRFNRRNHRKLLVVDERVCYFGGINIVDQSHIESAEQAKASHLLPSAGWRDVHLRLEGPPLAEVADSMDRLWRRELRLLSKRWPRWPVHRMLHERGEGIYFFDTRPSLQFRRADRVYIPLLRRARREITVSMAYFIPTGGVLRALLRARRRGVRVRVIVPGESDVKVVQWASRHLYGWLLRRGVEIYERQHRMLHSKLMVIDKRWSIVGSCNLDPRSLRTNLEFIGVLRSTAAAATMRSICEHEISRSRQITLDDYCQRRWWQRWLDRWAWSLRKWL